MMSLIFGLFTQVSGSGPLGPLVSTCFVCVWGGGGGGGGGQVQYRCFREKNNQLPSY